MKLLNINESAKFMRITVATFRYFIDKGVIAEHCLTGGIGGYVHHLWSEPDLTESLERLKKYKRGESITKAQKKYNKARVKKLNVIDKYAPLFKEFMHSHVKAIKGDI